jgi:hypothetical protein
MLPVMGTRSALYLAVAVLAGLYGPSASSGAPHLKRCNSDWRDDGWAKVLARSAQTAAETYATDHNGEYVGISRGRLRSIEPTIPLTPRQARREQYPAYLLTARGGRDSYNVTARTLDGATYTIVRESSGEIERFAHRCGVRVHW